MTDLANWALNQPVLLVAAYVVLYLAAVALGAKLGS